MMTTEGRKGEIMKSPIRSIIDSFSPHKGETKYPKVSLRKRMAERVQGSWSGRFAPSLQV